MNTRSTLFAWVLSGSVSLIPGLALGADDQDSCAEEAGRWFETHWGEGSYADAETVTLVNYQSYYNRSLAKCFARVEATTAFKHRKAAPSVAIFLNEIHENREYASYTWEDAKYRGRSRPLEAVRCVVGHQDCRSEQEFRQMIHQYTSE